MALEIVWRNPIPPEKTEWRVEPVAVDDFGAVYAVPYCRGDRSLRSDLGRRGLTEIDARGRLQVRSLTDRMILEKDYEVLMEAATIEDRTQFAKAYAPDDDLALVHAIRGGDVAAFEQLVKRYDRKLLRIARNVTHNSEDAEEAVQEVFFKVYQKLDQFQGHAKFSSWLIRITLNESFMKLRKQRAIREQSIDSNVYSDGDSERLPLDVADWAPDPEALYRASEFREILINCLQRLTPALEVVFVLRDIEEHSLRETSEILNLTETAVKTRLSRARLQLREDLSKYFKKPEL